MEEILFIIGLIRAGIAVAPDVEKFAVQAKEFISTLVSTGIIPAEKQNIISSHIDDLCAAHKAGNLPPEYVVEKDPTA